ncbi:MAG: TonB-dependent receptor plug domain-containing protein [Bacteroidales bacterium]|nr:TonB-dependent receptor plug domain-containing protein [Bacteroidales bacterium]
MTKINPLKAKDLPSINNNIEGLIKTLPGVSSNNELSSQYSVRGGNFDENLVYVNGIEVFRPLLIRAGEQEGLSFINPDLVASLEFSAGGFEAKYGDKISSVLDIKYKRPEKFGASVSLNMLGGSASVEAATKNNKFSILAGVRYKSNAYILGSMETKGNYKPNFLDAQMFMNWKISKNWEFEVLGNIADNSYKFTPTSSNKRFGTMGDAYDASTYFEGQEIDHFTTYFAAANLIYTPKTNCRNILSYSFFRSFENESFDILGAYMLSQTNSSVGSNDFGEPVEMLGVGSYLEHARNQLDAIVININYQGQYSFTNSLLMWGVKYQREDIYDRINEWKYVDSLGYSVPNVPTFPGEINIPQPIVLQNRYLSENNVISNRINTFVQYEQSFFDDLLTFNIGTRLSYWDFNNEWLLSPRASILFTFPKNPNISLVLTSGVYWQPPFYREMRNIYGEINSKIRSQRSIHVTSGFNWDFILWKRPFKLVVEAYYKHLAHLIPYEIDNVRIRYTGKNNAVGYATGLDFRLNGEFVKDAESWISLSFMNTRERINGGKWLPRPTDQLVNFNLFFQDYIPFYKDLRISLNLVLGSGLPYGNPKALEDETLFESSRTWRYPSYKRLDLGLYYQPHFLKFFVKYNIWIGIDVFNIFDINNTNSYTSFSTFDGGQYLVANYLTPRLFNFKISAKF